MGEIQISYHPGRDRTHYDLSRLDLEAKTTIHDSLVFGLWVNEESREITVFDKGWEWQCSCANDKEYQEMMADFDKICEIAA